MSTTPVNERAIQLRSPASPAPTVASASNSSAGINANDANLTPLRASNNGVPRNISTSSSSRNSSARRRVRRAKRAGHLHAAVAEEDADSLLWTYRNPHDFSQPIFSSSSFASTSASHSSSPISSPKLSSSPTVSISTHQHPFSARIPPRTAQPKAEMKQLKEMFAHVDDEIIQHLWQEMDGDESTIIDYLLSHSPESLQPPATSASPAATTALERSDSPLSSGSTSSQSYSSSATSSPEISSRKTSLAAVASMSRPLLFDSFHLPASVFSASASSASRSKWNSSRQLPLSMQDLLSPLSSDLFYLISSFLDYANLGPLLLCSRSLSSSISENFSSISSLNLAYHARINRHWSSSQLLSFLSRFPSLTTLSLRNLPQFCAFSALARAIFGKPLTSLSLAGMRALDDESLTELWAVLDQLQSVDLSRTRITDRSVNETLTQEERPQKSLSRLGLGHIKGLSAAAFPLLTSHFARSLTWLDVRSSNFLPSSLDRFFSSTPNVLTILNLSECKKFSQIAWSGKYFHIEQLFASRCTQLHSIRIESSVMKEMNFERCEKLETMHMKTPKICAVNFSGCVRLSEVAAPGATTEMAAMSLQPSVSLSSSTAVQHSALSSIDIRSCRSLPTNALSFLLCGSLSSLSILMCSGCPLLSAEAFAPLLAVLHSSAQASEPQLGNLLSVSAEGCAGVDNGLLAEIVDKARQNRKKKGMDIDCGEKRDKPNERIDDNSAVGLDSR